ncbi:tetratricopeptide repeat protein [Anatilimnocola aggregata]|nr:tetratricopeptide repeat protein [Anatilimnocola aggregata]
MVTAPFALVLIDVALVAGSWSAMFRERRFWHVANFVAIPVAFTLIVRQGGRGGTVGTEHPSDRLAYLVLQSESIVNYLKLCYWPSPLIFDYGTVIPPLSASQLPAFIAVASLAMLAVIYFWRQPIVGLLGVLFFLILGPTSSLVPVTTQVTAEHRMYLPLALVLTGSVVALAWALIRFAPLVEDARQQNAVVLNRLRWITAGLTVVLVTLTFFRNTHYRSDFALWQDTALKVPTNLRACRMFGMVLMELGAKEAAIHIFDVAIDSPLATDAYCARSEMLLTAGDFDLAAKDARSALKIDPNCHLALNLLGGLAFKQNDNEAALEFFDRALSYEPKNATYLRNRGGALIHLDRLLEARENYETALAIAPVDPESHFALAMLDLREGRLAMARQGLQQTLYYNANHPGALQSLPDVEKQIILSKNRGP